MNKADIKKLQTIVNRVRQDAPQGYQDNVRELGDSLAEFSESFFEYEPAINDFAKGLINLFAKIIWTNGTYSHNLDFLKKGNYSTGIDFEDIHVNPTMPAEYDRDDTAGILGHYDPETLVCFHRENRHDIFPQSINEEILSKAFQSWDNLGGFIARIKQAVETGNYVRELNLVKKAIVDGHKVKQMFTTKAVDLSTDEGVANAMTMVREDINGMQFVSDKYNKYATASGTGKKARLVSKRDDIFIMTTVKNEAKVRKFLSGVFNIQELEDANRFVLLDDFGYDKYAKVEDARQLVIEGHEDSDIAFLIADKHLVQWWERLKVKTVFENGYTLDVNTFLHIWQTISLSYLANAVVYTEATSGTATSVDPAIATFTTDTDSQEFEFTDINGDTVTVTSVDDIYISGIKDIATDPIVMTREEILELITPTVAEGGTLNVAVVEGATGFASIQLTYQNATIQIVFGITG